MGVGVVGERLGIKGLKEYVFGIGKMKRWGVVGEDIEVEFGS